MQLLPLNNPTLLRRAGYKDVLKGWGLLRWSSAIRWDGLETFSGNNRNVAKLYELWCYLKIAEILSGKLDMREAWSAQTLHSMWAVGDGEIGIGLRKGKTSRRYFVTREARGGSRIVVGLHYNAMFGLQPAGPEEANKWDEASSYALSFQPDITLSIFRVPEHEGGGNDFSVAERESERRGTIRHLHFDAKYRLEFKGVSKDGKESTGFKNEDLEKMLAYTEAIRRTCGAFVLYPGTEVSQIYSLAKGGKRSVFFRYEEVIPGVGAFALRPSADEKGSTNVECFLRDVIREVFADRGKTDELVVREAMTAATSNLAVVGYARPCADSACQANKIFFAHARRGSMEIPLSQQISRGLPLYVHNGGPDIAWSARIEWITTVTRDQLESIVGSGVLTTPDVSRYYLFHLNGKICPFTKTSAELGFNAKAHRPYCMANDIFTRGKVEYLKSKRPFRSDA